MDTIIELATPFITGILLGGLYTLIALGLSMVFGRDETHQRRPRRSGYFRQLFRLPGDDHFRAGPHPEPCHGHSTVVCYRFSHSEIPDGQGLSAFHGSAAHHCLRYFPGPGKHPAGRLYPHVQGVVHLVFIGKPLHRRAIYSVCVSAQFRGSPSLL